MSEDKLDSWLSSFYDFRFDFLSFCHPVAKSLGYAFEFDQPLLEAAHNGWVSSHAVWLADRMVPDTTGLSHLKIMGILLHHLCRGEWVREITVFPNDECQFNGSEEVRLETAKDFNAGRHVFFSLEFAFQVINWYEIGRIDRRTDFQNRITSDFYHDFMVYLLGDRHDELAVFLILKSLYAREPKSA